jgi:prepilin-type processing-associated H-X9-DG protein
MVYAAEHNGRFPMPLRSSPASGWNTTLSVEYGTGKATVTNADTDRTSADPVFVEPLYKRPASRPLNLYRYDSGYGMNAYLPPCKVKPLTVPAKAYETNPILSMISNPSLTLLVADTTNCRWYSEKASWSLETAVEWHIQFLIGYCHRSKGNVLYVDGHVESQSVTQAVDTYTTTTVYKDLLNNEVNVTW